MNTAPDWLRNAIITGLQNLIALSLPSAPAHEVLPMTVEVWIRTLWSAPQAWDEALDTVRIDAGFAELARICDRWPVPKQLLACLPARPAPPALPAPKPSTVVPAFVHEARARARASFAELRDRLTMTPWQRRAADEAAAAAAADQGDQP